MSMTAKAVDANKVAEARLPEMLQMHELCQGARFGVQGLPRHLRRRTRSHNSYRHGKRPRVGGIEVDSTKRVMNRKMRRKQMFRTYQGNPFDIGSSGSDGRVGTSDGTDSKTKKNVILPTHVFHAKRMTMRAVEGFVLADGQPGKGHGTRSFAHKLATGCVVHDASYWCSIELFVRNGRWNVVQGVVDAATRSRQPLLQSTTLPGSTSSPSSPLSPSTSSEVTLWAHYTYAMEAVARIHAVGAVDTAKTRVGRLGRIELRGPRSNEVLAEAVRSMKTDSANPQHEVYRVGETGCSVVATREAYADLFKAICGTGGAFLCGQREWHWCQTMCGLQFYPDDYVDGNIRKETGTVAETETTPDVVPVRVWVRNKGVLEAGMELVEEKNEMTGRVGVVTSPKPRMLSNKFCSIGWARLDRSSASSTSKWRLSARRPGDSVRIAVTVREL